jgi:hypothetical protein
MATSGDFAQPPKDVISIQDIQKFISALACTE